MARSVGNAPLSGGTSSSSHQHGQQQQQQHHQEQHRAGGQQRQHSTDSDHAVQIGDDDSTSPPFLPLEEQAGGGGGSEMATIDIMESTSISPTSANATPIIVTSSSAWTRLRKLLTKNISGKRIVSLVMFTVIGLVILDALFTEPEDRWLKPEFTDIVLEWVQEHPASGMAAILLVIAGAVVVMVPIGTPLTLGCGYIYKGAYGWKTGLAVATAVAMGGSALGAVICFLLGRYLMREQVRKWIKKYPIFDAIDVAASEHGLRIMAMLYLTPILPLGPVSYMCGTTSMALSSFVLAKIASLPLMLLYAFIGASMSSLIGKSAAAELKEIEENETLIVSGILLSLLMIFGITKQIQKELNKILERQGKHKPGEMTEQSDSYNADGALEESASGMELGAAHNTAPRQRKQVS